MSDLLNMVLEATRSIALIGMGVLMVVVFFFLAFRRSRRTQTIALQLLDLALTGKADQARIRARTEGRSIAPLLEALSGDVRAPLNVPFWKELIWIFVVTLPLVLLIVFGSSELTATAPPETRVQVAAAMLIGTAVLLPLILTYIIAAIEFADRARRVVRGACVTILATSVKTAVDADHAEALRKGKVRRDPRGE